ncbi:MAG: FAS1-like dehydratase domain-containing protein [Pseudonocardiaceae bacterium]
MPLDKEFVGRTYPPTEPYEVGREKIREFADAIGETSPVTRDATAARELGYSDVIAPPTFPIVLSIRASNQVIFDPALGLDFSRVVHRAQRFVCHRPVRAGDRLTVVVTVTDIDHIGGNDVITIRGEISTVDGEPVCTMTSTAVSRAEAGV